MGSLREWVIILLLNKLEDIEHARLRAVVQVLLDKDKGVEAFEDYMKIAFPYLEGRKKQQKDDAQKALMSWIKEGPLKVTPLHEEKRGASKLRKKVAAKMASEEVQHKTNKVLDEWKKQRGQ